MRCQQARILLTKQLRETLTTEQSVGLSQHFHACPACRAEQSAMETFAAQLGQDARAVAPMVDAHSLALKSWLAKSPPAWRALRRARIALQALGSILLVALLARPWTVLPREAVATQNGMNVRFRPDAMDREGNILASVDAWTTDYADWPVPPSLLISQRTWPQDYVLDPPPLRDERGRTYLLAWSLQEQKRSAPMRVWILLTPLEPLSKNEPLPHALTTALNVCFPRSRQAPQGDFELSVSLPEPSLPSLASWDVNNINTAQAVNEIENLEAVIYRARKNYYHLLVNARRYGTPESQQAVEWAEKYIAIATSKDVQWARLSLAERYFQGNEKARAFQLLTDILNDKRFPCRIYLPSPFFKEARQQFEAAANSETYLPRLRPVKNYAKLEFLSGPREPL